MLNFTNKKTTHTCIICECIPTNTNICGDMNWIGNVIKYIINHQLKVILICLTMKLVLLEYLPKSWIALGS